MNPRCTRDDFKLGGNLTSEQQQAMTELLRHYGDVFSDVPGRTDLTQHVIKVTDETKPHVTKIPIEYLKP